MFLKADLVQKEVDPPKDYWCASGHKAPQHFKEKNTKFFNVSGLGINGIYCELCLIVSHYLAKSSK